MTNDTQTLLERLREGYDRNDLHTSAIEAADTIEALSSALAAARGVALEESAEVADQFSKTSRMNGWGENAERRCASIAVAIRALPTKQEPSQ